MLIDTKNKRLFIHIAKTGGTSISKHFGDRDGVYHNHIPKEYLVKEAPSIIRVHRSASYIKNLMGSHYDEFNSFAVVRNPYARMVSLWSFVKEKQLRKISKSKKKVKKNKLKASKEIVFQKEYEKIYNFDFKEFVKYYIERDYIPEGIRIRQTDNLFENGNLIVNNIIKFENLNEDFFNIFNEKLPVKNKGRYKKKYYEYYDDEVKSIVKNFFYDDFENFGYGIDL